MFLKIYNYLFKSYHRPSAKILHFIILFKSIFFNKKTEIMSEKMMLLKNPPISVIFYNSLGRLLILIANSVFIILFNKFFESKIVIDSIENKKNINLKGNNLTPWPLQAMHVFENIKDVDDNTFDLIEKNYQLTVSSLSKHNRFKDSPWWIECREEFKKIFINNNLINRNEFKNFRNNKNTKAALLADQSYFKGNILSRFNKFKSLSLINLYHKLSTKIDINILRSCSESYSGKSYALNYRGQRLSHRVLRYAYYTSQLKKYVNFSNDRTIILDLGGGYGGLSRMLKNEFKNATFIIIEIPEVCAFAHYFLQNNFPESKIGSYQNFLNLKTVHQSDLKQFDFVILPQTMIEKFDDAIIDLSINTTSLGEMTNEVQDYYLVQLERITKKYFYSVNRAESRSDKYNAQGFYDLNFSSRWKSLIYKFSHTYHIEFLGEKND